MSKKLSSITEYFTWILQEYKAAKAEMSPSTLYRLIEIKEKGEQQYELSFQLIGKSIAFKATPEEILNNDKLIEYFSSKDIRIITELACKQLKQPKNKIIGKSFSAKLNKLLFQIKHSNEDAVDENTAAELSIDKELIKNLAPEDAHIIGYTAAQEKQQDEKQAIEELRNKEILSE